MGRRFARCGAGALGGMMAMMMGGPGRWDGLARHDGHPPPGDDGRRVGTRRELADDDDWHGDDAAMVLMMALLLLLGGAVLWLLRPARTRPRRSTSWRGASRRVRSTKTSV